MRGRDSPQCTALRGVLLLLMVYCCSSWCTAPHDVLLLMMYCSSWCTAPHGVLLFMVYCSCMCRDRNRLQMILGFNAWEVQADRKDFGTSPIPHVEGSDFWMTRFRVPEECYEINFVVTDCEGKFENNAGQDFTYPVVVRGGEGVRGGAVGAWG